MYGPSMPACTGEGTDLEKKHMCLSLSVSSSVKPKGKDGDVVVLFTDQVSDEKQLKCSILNGVPLPGWLCLSIPPWGHFPPSYMDVSPPLPFTIGLEDSGRCTLGFRYQVIGFIHSWWVGNLFTFPQCA